MKRVLLFLTLGLLVAVGVRAEDDPLKEMREVLNNEVKAKKSIELLGLENKKLELQLENQKMTGELKGISGFDTGFELGSEGKTGGKLSIKLLFLATADNFKEAILSINNIKYFVKEGESPLPNLVVESINDESVVIVMANDEKLTLNVNYLGE